MLIDINLVKCDYCDEVYNLEKNRPDGWLIVHMPKTKFPEFGKPYREIVGKLTTCPYHTSVIELIGDYLKREDGIGGKNNV